MSDEQATTTPIADADRWLLHVSENIFAIEIVKVFLHPGFQFVREERSLGFGLKNGRHRFH